MFTRSIFTAVNFDIRADAGDREGNTRSLDLILHSKVEDRESLRLTLWPSNITHPDYVFTSSSSKSKKPPVFYNGIISNTHSSDVLGYASVFAASSSIVRIGFFF